MIAAVDKPAHKPYPGTTSGLVHKNNGPYTGVQLEQKITLNGRTFIILTYQAYNALGLIGSECNGICILDEDNRRVICDEIEKEGTGWCGVSRKQWDKAHELLDMDWQTFQAFVNNHPRARYSI